MRQHKYLFIGHQQYGRVEESRAARLIMYARKGNPRQNSVPNEDDNFGLSKAHLRLIFLLSVIILLRGYANETV